MRLFGERREELVECYEGGSGEAEAQRILGTIKAAKKIVAGGEEGTGAGEESVEGIWNRGGVWR